MKETIALIGCDAPKAAIENLEREFEVFILPPDDLIAPEISSHPDMILSVMDGKLFCHNTYYNKNKALLDTIARRAELDVVASKCERSKDYPYDIAFNVLICENTVLAKESHICPDMRIYPITDTNQGYAGCTSLFASGHIITADSSIIKSAVKANIPTYRISGKDILLGGYDTGFIGGACGVFGDKIYICGDYRHSKSGIELYEFCKQFSLELISLCDGDVYDIGGIKFINTAVENK